MMDDESKQPVSAAVSSAGVGGVESDGCPQQSISQQQQQQSSQQAAGAAGRPQYSIPGILHYIQHEWARFELERAQWEVERTELQTRIAFLQGERKGQECLKNDLVRRIKMLEYALRQERTRIEKLRQGVSGAGPVELEEEKPPQFDSPDDAIGNDILGVGNGSGTTGRTLTWKQGRELLRQYLQEIGFTDTILDVRSARVQTLLGLQSSNSAGSMDAANSASGGSAVNGGAGGGVIGGGGGAVGMLDAGTGSQQLHRRSRGPCSNAVVNSSSAVTGVPGAAARSADVLRDAEASVLATFDFLAAEGGSAGTATDGTDEDDEDDVVMASPGAAAGCVDELLRPPCTQDPEGTLGLGELAGLTVNNEFEPQTKDSLKKWDAKYTLRSHFDGVRALAFHPVDPVLVTASEDNTLKLWNLQKTLPAKKGAAAALDVEPLYTFRGHTGPVLCLAMAPGGDRCYSGSLDATICVWNIPNSNVDPYDAYDPRVLAHTLSMHTDAVWGLAVQAGSGGSYPHHLLLSCSADSTVRLWNVPATATPSAGAASPSGGTAADAGGTSVQPTLLETFMCDAIPTTVDFVRSLSGTLAQQQAVVGYSNGDLVALELETGKPVIRYDTAMCGGSQINRVVSHPTLGITMTGHEDRCIRFFDNATGKLIHSMVAHLDSVTSISIDPNGMYLLSASHDCSIRLWHLDNRTCVQEVTSHRKKFDEAVNDVAFHPSKAYIASAGADSLVKVFV